MSIVYLALGSNLGEREQNILAAIEKLSDFTKVTKKSRLYETEPVGYAEQGKFLNAVIKTELTLNPRKLLQEISRIEYELKRERKIKNGPRTIDIDILFYDSKIIIEHDLIIPHPRLHERRFVLEPLSEIEPDFIHPLSQKTIYDLLKELQ